MIADEISKINEKLLAKNLLDTAVIEETDWIETILLICQEHGFTEEDALEIVREVGYLLLDVSDVPNFYNQIKERTKLSETSIRVFCNDLDKRLLQRIVKGYEILEQNLDIHLKKLEQEEIENEKTHILIVPIKPKEGQSTEEKEVVIPDSAIYIDPYKEIPE